MLSPSVVVKTVRIESRTESGGSRLHVQCRLSCGSCVCALATAVQLHVKRSCKHVYLNYKREKVDVFVEQRVNVVCGMTAHGVCRCAAGSKFSNRLVTFESNSNRDVRFEFESNLEASQVPSQDPF